MEGRNGRADDPVPRKTVTQPRGAAVMASQLCYRLLSMLLVVLGVVTIVFLFIHLTPGDPVEAMLGESASQADRAGLRRELGLDRPLPVQYGEYLARLVRGDLGHSIYSGRPVSALLAERLPATALLAAVALLVALAIALPLGLLGALRAGTLWDRLAMGFAMLGVSIPNFWLGPMLILCFSLWLGWFPVSGNEGNGAIVLPAITLGTAMAALLSRMLRASVLEVLGEDHVRTARAKGLAPAGVITRHVLPNAALPVLTVLGLQLGTLLGGAVVTETVFAWPGLGTLTIEAIQRRDYPVVQGCVLLISLAYVGVNTLTDLAYGLLDPRVRPA